MKRKNESHRSNDCAQNLKILAQDLQDDASGTMLELVSSVAILWRPVGRFKISYIPSSVKDDDDEEPRKAVEEVSALRP